MYQYAAIGQSRTPHLFSLCLPGGGASYLIFTNQASDDVIAVLAFTQKDVFCSPLCIAYYHIS